MKKYIVITFLLILILGLYFLNKAEKRNKVSSLRSSSKRVIKLDIKAKAETITKRSNIKEPEVEQVNKSFDEVYKFKMEKFLKEDSILEDDDGTQWRSLKKEWLLRLEKYLEIKLGSKKKAKKMLLKYFSIIKQYQKNKEVKELYKEYDDAAKKYLDLNRYGNISEAEKTMATKRYRDLSKKLKKSRSKLVDQKKELFGKYYNEILNELENYNDEVRAKHSHLGYTIGFGL